MPNRVEIPTGCTCKPPEGDTFFCERHGIYKTRHYYHLCSTDRRYFDRWEQGIGAGQGIPGVTNKNNQKLGLGDRIEQALSAVGITEERVSKWLGRPCGCKARKEKLNRLGRWAARVLSGRTEDAEKHLDNLMK